MKVYFITYLWKRAGEASWNPENKVITELPLQWLLDRQAKSNEISYTLVFFQRIELSEMEFEKYADSF